MGKPVGRQINLKQDPPASVEQMKDGEMRVGEDGILARVGDQVLQRSWMKTLLYDDFEDGIVDPAWNGIWTNKGGGFHTESGGYLELSTNFGGSGGQYGLIQEDILGVGDPIAIKGDFYFDVWGKMILPIVPDTNTFTAEIQFNFFASSVAEDYVRISLRSDGGNTNWQVVWSWHDGNSARNSSSGLVPFGAGANELWWRFRYQPGDSYIRTFYHHGPENPFDSPYEDGWTEFVYDKYYPQPTGNDELQVQLYSVNYSNDTTETVFYNELAEWEGGQTTTTTTTTTTAPFVDFTDDTYWQDSGQVDELVWSGTFWWPQIGNGIEGLEPIGIWSVGFRPTKLRIDIVGASNITGLIVKDTDGNTIGDSAGVYWPNQELDLTFVGYDIGEIVMDSGSSTVEYHAIELK